MILGNLLVAATLLALAFAGFETYYRFLYDSTDAFGLDRATRRWFEGHWERNTQGFRDDRDYQRACTPGTPRVSFLGDSFTAGHGVERVEDALVHRIRAARPDWELQCLAQTGLDTAHQIDLLVELLQAGHELDTVVLVYCPNDIMSADPRTADVLRRISLGRPDPGYWMTHSYAVNVLSHRILSRRDPDVAEYCAFASQAYDIPEVWAEQRRLLARLQQVVESAGGRLFVVTFPFLHAASQPQRRERTHERLRAFWSARGVPHLDLRAVLSKAPPGELIVNAFDPHPNARAHEIAAQAIERFLALHVR